MDATRESLRGAQRQAIHLSRRMGPRLVRVESDGPRRKRISWRLWHWRRRSPPNSDPSMFVKLHLNIRNCDVYGGRYQKTVRRMSNCVPTKPSYYRGAYLGTY